MDQRRVGTSRGVEEASRGRIGGESGWVNGGSVAGRFPVAAGRHGPLRRHKSMKITKELSPLTHPDSPPIRPRLASSTPRLVPTRR